MSNFLRLSRKDKLILKLQNPASDGNWTMPDVVKLLTLSGYKETGGRGSHRVFTSPSRPEAITLAAHGDSVKSGYLRMIRSILLT